jgi:hypothetical protein
MADAQNTTPTAEDKEADDSVAWTMGLSGRLLADDAKARLLERVTARRLAREATDPQD